MLLGCCSAGFHLCTFLTCLLSSSGIAGAHSSCIFNLFPTARPLSRCIILPPCTNLFCWDSLPLLPRLIWILWWFSCLSLPGAVITGIKTSPGFVLVFNYIITEASWNRVRAVDVVPFSSSVSKPRAFPLPLTARRRWWVFDQCQISARFCFTSSGWEFGLYHLHYSWCLVRPHLLTKMSPFPVLVCL